MTGTVTLSWQTIITAASVLVALATILKYYNKGYEHLKRQKKQDEIIKNTQGELIILTGGVLAALKGLKELGANGPVTDAIRDIENHINERAHAHDE